MIFPLLCLLLLSLWPFAEQSLQHPTGFTTVEECRAQGAPATILFQEDDSQQWVLALERGAVINEGGIVTHEGKILKDTETYGQDQHSLLRPHRDIASEDPLYFDGVLAVISSPGQENWYHWLFQVLPRLKILADSGVAYDKIYLDNLLYPWQRESLDIALQLLHIPRERLLLREGDAIIQASTLLIPSVPFIPSKSPVFPSWLKEFLRTSFLRAEGEGHTPERIYISRSKAHVRRIANESALIDLLIERGFVILHLEELSVYEQARLFYHAKVIVGPHGSGFTNLIFSQPWTCVVEIDHGLIGDDQRSFYRRMAKIMECEYRAYYADIVEEEDLDSDIYVNLSDFIPFIRE